MNNIKWIFSCNEFSHKKEFTFQLVSKKIKTSITENNKYKIDAFIAPWLFLYSLSIIWFIVTRVIGPFVIYVPVSIFAEIKFIYLYIYLPKDTKIAEFHKYVGGSHDIVVEWFTKKQRSHAVSCWVFFCEPHPEITRDTYIVLAWRRF